ncbi:MAG TPA: helix-turn-helix domain-containing protein, partial [Methylotenera sp.]|nr:helix-turn-helix domain-containing protein [Methylotenera sp.]
MKKMREKILSVATTLFETRGIHASGVDMIIAESGIAKSTLYKYF